MCEFLKDELAFTTLPSFVLDFSEKKKGIFGEIMKVLLRNKCTTGCRDISGTFSFEYTVFCCCTRIYISKIITCLDWKLMSLLNLSILTRNTKTVMFLMVPSAIPANANLFSTFTVTKLICTSQFIIYRNV